VVLTGPRSGSQVPSRFVKYALQRQRLMHFVFNLLDKHLRSQQERDGDAYYPPPSHESFETSV
jgi:hypothetical protein